MPSKTTIETVGEFFDKLGGTVAAAEALGCSPSFISDMRRRNEFAKSRRLDIHLIAERKGWTIRPELLGK